MRRTCPQRLASTSEAAAINYYRWHIGDYRRDTAHLSMLEHGAYRQLLDSYYLNEKPLPLDDATLMRTHCARSAEEMQAVRNVLADFFVKTDEGYVHKHCERELEAYKAKSDKARESANARWQKEIQIDDANALRPDCDGNANHKPITNNQITTPQPPQGGIPVKRQSKTRTQKIGIDEFIAQCQKAGEKPIQPDDPIFDYLLRIGLPEEFGALAWEWFKRRYASNTQAGVRGWRQAFRNAVEGNWPRYWFQADDGTWQLTTAGKQAQADYHALQHQERAA